MLDCMDGHALIGDIALYSSIISDGGPRMFKRRGVPLPEKYLPGRFLAGLRPHLQAAVVRAVNEEMSPAPWFLRQIVDEEEPRVAVPPPPLDRRWSSHGRWSLL